ncbi:MAG: Rieske (2Fe-2S) protein [Planctomycetes bacterium]|nr:Rieske (2Fe-2S) protein [Planctomycetota bacterium]
MATSLAASYGTLAVLAGRFLYPAGSSPAAWMFLADMAGMKPGDSFLYRTPAGASVAVARVGTRGDAGDFLALSSTCPHLGCQVHWEPHNNRFFCPCHNGTFDPTGKATSGPPAAAGQSLPRYPLKAEKGLLYILVPVGAVS